MIRSVYNHKKRPILINNWEATYFKFDHEKLLEIAREAKKCGIEMLVMDDGWFSTCARKFPEYTKCMAYTFPCCWSVPGVTSAINGCS